MGHGYSIMVWDDWAAGLNMVNPRVLHEDMGPEKGLWNWFPCPEATTEEMIDRKHNLTGRFGPFWRVIR